MAMATMVMMMGSFMEAQLLISTCAKTLSAPNASRRGTKTIPQYCTCARMSRDLSTALSVAQTEIRASAAVTTNIATGPTLKEIDENKDLTMRRADQSLKN